MSVDDLKTIGQITLLFLYWGAIGAGLILLAAFAIVAVRWALAVAV